MVIRDIVAASCGLRLETVALPVSSSGIRAALALGERAEELPAAVAAYMREQGLDR